MDHAPGRGGEQGETEHTSTPEDVRDDRTAMPKAGPGVGCVWHLRVGFQSASQHEFMHQPSPPQSSVYSHIRTTAQPYRTSARSWADPWPTR